MSTEDAAFWLGAAISVPFAIAIVLIWQTIRASRAESEDSYNPYDPEAR